MFVIIILLIIQSLSSTFRLDNDHEDASDVEVAEITEKSDEEARELGMKLLEIKELHPDLNREVTRHKFPGATGIDVVVMPATPCDSPVSSAQPVIKEKPKDLDLNVGETALFELVLNDSQGVNVSWSKNGKLLFGSGKLKIWSKDTSYFLEVSRLDADDEDLYECRARNDFGEVMCDVQLLVNGKVLYTLSIVYLLYTCKHSWAILNNFRNYLPQTVPMRVIFP
jgi:Immunoglobulin I-set domain.